MPFDINELHEIAASTRASFETGSISLAHLLELGETYFPNEAETWRLTLPHALPMFPQFGCEPATAALRHRVGYGEIVDGSYDTYPHTFLNVGITAIANETVLDITSDQFGGPSIYVGPLSEPWANSRSKGYHDGLVKKARQALS